MTGFSLFRLKINTTQISLHCVIDDWLENVNNGACLLDIAFYMS